MEQYVLILDMKSFGIIEKLGGRPAVSAALRESGARTHSVDAIRMWAQRGSIPGNALRALLAEAERKGVEISSDDFDVIEVGRVDA